MHGEEKKCKKSASKDVSALIVSEKYGEKKKRNYELLTGKGVLCSECE